MAKGQRSPSTRLTEEQRGFIVTELACFRTPTQVSNALKEEFNVDFSRDKVEYYDPTKGRAKRGKLAKKWVALFETTRKEYLADIAAVPIANRRYQLEQLQEMYEAAGRNLMLKKELVIEAAKITGDVYSARRVLEHTGKNGGPIEIAGRLANVPDSELFAGRDEAAARALGDG